MEPAIVLDKIRRETVKDSTLQQLSQTIQTGAWKAHKKDPDITDFITVKEELPYMRHRVLSLDWIYLSFPRNYNRKWSKLLMKWDTLERQRQSKFFVRTKYWFPGMNSIIDELIGGCCECQVTTRQHTEQPIKPSVIPDKPWEKVCIDFGGPYPDGHYNLVAVDKRTRYPEVEVVFSASFEPTKAKLKQMFGHHGIPQRIDSDNGPPFNSKEFSHFAEQ